MPVSHMTIQAYFFSFIEPESLYLFKETVADGFEYDYVSSVYLLKLSFWQILCHAFV